MWVVRGQRPGDELLSALGVLRLPTRGWELGAGALVALATARLERLPAALAAPLTWLGLACVALAAVWYDDETPFPGYHALLPVLGSALVLAGGCAPASHGAGWLLGRRPMVWLGGLSYGWYLWHWPLLVVAPVALGLTDGTAGCRSRSGCARSRWAWPG
ncbi:acyltransferase [Streptomyces mirabilis]|nr:acyltransferase [Streptomyces mirabilis]